MGIKYIYAGYSKCGTKTIAAAFRILGYKVHDYEESITETAATWTEFYKHNKDNNSPEEKIKILQKGLADFDVVMDSPCHVIWYEILLAFPEAKVIFYERPIEKWWPSFVRHNQALQRVPLASPPDFLNHLFIEYFNPSLLIYKDSSFFPLYYGHNVRPFKNWRGENAPLDELFVKRMYRRHCSDVLSNCPKDKLLVLDDINCGWKVICDFTGDNLPMEKGDLIKWPHENKNAAIVKVIFGDRDNTDTRVLKYLKNEAKQNAINYLKKFVFVGLFWLWIILAFILK